MVINETRSGMLVHVCDDCRHWSHAGQVIVHSKRCDARECQPVLTPATTKGERNARAKVKAPSSRQAGPRTPDEVFEAYERGEITMSEAMQQDD